MPDFVRFLTQNDTTDPAQSSGFNGFPFATPAQVPPRVWNTMTDEWDDVAEASPVAVTEWDGTTLYEYTADGGDRTVRIPSGSATRWERVVGNNCGYLKMPLKDVIKFWWRVKALEINTIEASISVDFLTYGSFTTEVDDVDSEGGDVVGGRELDLVTGKPVSKPVQEAAFFGELYWEDDEWSEHTESGSGGSFTTDAEDGDDVGIAFSDFWASAVVGHTTLDAFQVTSQPGYIYVHISDLFSLNDDLGYLQLEGFTVVAQAFLGYRNETYQEDYENEEEEEVFDAEVFVPITSTVTLTIFGSDYTVPMSLLTTAEAMPSTYDLDDVEDWYDVTSAVIDVELVPRGYWPYAVQPYLPDGVTAHPNAGDPVYNTTTGAEIRDPVTGF